MSYVVELELVDATDPADRSRDLADQGVADGVWFQEESGVDVGGYRKTGVVEGDGIELGD